MSRKLTTAAIAACALGLAACNTAKPAPQYVGRMAMTVRADPATVLSTLRSAVSEQGGQVTAQSADTIQVNFGQQTRRVPVPTEYGLWGTRVTYRDTEVWNAATYTVQQVQGGTVVTILQNPIYWHPDIQTWLPGPHDMVPGLDALVSLAGTQ